MSKVTAQHTDAPARQRLLDLGVPEADLDRAHALGLGGGFLQGLLAKIAPLLIQTILEALSKGAAPTTPNGPGA